LTQLISYSRILKEDKEEEEGKEGKEGEGEAEEKLKSIMKYQQFQ